MSDHRRYDFRSDNVAGVAPEVLTAISKAALGSESSYGEDTISKRLESKLAEIFEHEVAVFSVATGTAANSLALASIVPGWGSILCHHEAHIATDECGAPEFFSGGAKLVLLDGFHGKITAEEVASYLRRDARGVHHVQPSAVSISQSTEAGTCYRPEEIAALGEICLRHGLGFHMDGARFANAQARLGCTPAEATWRAGVDILSFGLTKNGAMSAEAVVFFDPSRARDFAFRRKRSGHLFSKMRFVSAQMEALLNSDLWIKLAGHSNQIAHQISQAVAGNPRLKLLHPVEANELFVLMPSAAIEALEQEGYRFYRWETDQGPCIRLVTAFDTDPVDADALADAIIKAIS